MAGSRRAASSPGSNPAMCCCPRSPPPSTTRAVSHSPMSPRCSTNSSPTAKPTTRSSASPGPSCRPGNRRHLAARYLLRSLDAAPDGLSSPARRVHRVWRARCAGQPAFFHALRDGLVCQRRPPHRQLGDVSGVPRHRRPHVPQPCRSLRRRASARHPAWPTCASSSCRSSPAISTANCKPLPSSNAWINPADFGCLFVDFALDFEVSS